MFKRVVELIDAGGNYEKAVYYASRCHDLEEYNFWAEAINRIKIDKEHRFAYTAIPNEVYKKYKIALATRQVADNFLRNINDTDFGIVIVDLGNGEVKVSARTRTPEFFVLSLLERMGGGGHLTGGGAHVKGKDFDDAVEKVLTEARKFAKENNKE